MATVARVVAIASQATIHLSSPTPMTYTPQPNATEVQFDADGDCILVFDDRHTFGVPQVSLQPNVSVILPIKKNVATGWKLYKASAATRTSTMYSISISNLVGSNPPVIP